MDISTRTVLRRTLATTNDHLELDHLVDYEEKFADVSIEYKAYNDYDTTEVPIFDPEKAKEFNKENSAKMRHTHLPFTDSTTEFKEKMENILKFYIDNNLWPASNFFKGPKEDPEPELPTYDISDNIDSVDAEYYEENNQKYYKLSIGEGDSYPQITLVTITDSKNNINPDNIVEGKCTIVEEAGKPAKILKSADINLDYISDVEYHVSGSVKTEDAEYIFDTNVPLVAHEQGGEPINPSDIEVYEPTEEEAKLADAIVEALKNGEVPEGETRFELTTTSTTYTLNINSGETLTNIVIPDINKTLKINGNIKSGTKINYVTAAKKTIYLNSTNEQPIDININTNGTVYATGKYDDVLLKGPSFTSSGPAYAEIYGNVIIADDVEKSVSVQAKFVGNPNTIISNTEQSITVTARNENANIDIECPNSTVTLGGGNYNNVEANVSENTLKLTTSTFIKKLKLKQGNIHINNGKNIINELVENIECDYQYAVTYNKAATLPAQPSACEYTMESDRTGICAWSPAASGDTVINLNNHNIIGNTNRTAALYPRYKAHVEINAGDSIDPSLNVISNNQAYAVWGNDQTVITINGGHFIGNTHVIYSYKGEIYINGGEFELTGEYDKDAKGHAKFLLNCYDQNFTARTAKIVVKGGKFHNFNPAEAYSEPTQPYNYVAEGYESVCIDEANQIFEVRKL